MKAKLLIVITIAGLGLATGSAALTAVALVLGAFGINQRLREYR